MLPDSGAISGEIGQARREGRAGASCREAGRSVRLPFGLSAALAPPPERVKRGRKKQREGLDVQRPAEEEDAAETEAAWPEEAAPVPPGKGTDKSKGKGNHREEPDFLNVLLGLEEPEEGPEAPAAHLGVI